MSCVNQSHHDFVRSRMETPTDFLNQWRVIHLMEDSGKSSTFKATWGRVGQNGVSKEYPLRDCFL